MSIANNCFFRSNSLSLLHQTKKDDVTGDGTSSTVLLCGELLKQAERYTSEGLHPRIITDGYDIARDAALKFLDTFKISNEGENNTVNRELLTCITATSLKTKLDHELADGITEAIVDSMLCVMTDDDKPVDLNMIEVMTIERKMGTDSRFVNGLVLDHGGRHPDMPKVLNKCHIMTCNVSFEYEKTEVQSGFFYSSAEEREQLVESERKWLDDRCKAVIDFKRSMCKDGEVCVLFCTEVLFDLSHYIIYPTKTMLLSTTLFSIALCYDQSKRD